MIVNFKRVTLIASLIFLFSSCSEVKNEVIIKKDKDTVSVNEVVEIQLSIEHFEGFLPDFRLIRKEDTARLWYHKKENVANIKFTREKKGKHSFKGFVNYIDKNEIRKKQNFEFSFFVK